MSFLGDVIIFGRRVPSSSAFASFRRIHFGFLRRSSALRDISRFFVDFLFEISFGISRRSARSRAFSFDDVVRAYRFAFRIVRVIESRLGKYGR